MRLTPVQTQTVLLVVWGLLLPPTVLWWSQSILWVSFMSWYAIVGTHWSTRNAARAEAAVIAQGSTD